MSGHGRLTDLQDRLLAEFMRRSDEFHLGGGGALAGFHLGHRTTRDLDLFTAAARLDAGSEVLRDVVALLGGRLDTLISGQHHRRYLATVGDEALVIDLLHDPTPGSGEQVEVVDGIRIASARSILADKLCTLLSRSELRDLVDVRALESRGLDPVASIPAAMRRDAGLTPALLAWTLENMPIPDDARIPGGLDAEALRAWRDALVSRLVDRARPR